jgi:hypothetical protein
MKPQSNLGPFQQPYGRPLVYEDGGETFEALQWVIAETLPKGVDASTRDRASIPTGSPGKFSA